MKKKELLHGLTNDEKASVKSALKVAKECNFESKHTIHVTRLALEIFDDLKDLHSLSARERYYLLCASLLHDIGVHTEGPFAHHKTALNIILSTPLLQFNQKERLIIGSIARYHRRALPSLKHDHFKALNPPDRKMVTALAGILRVADGLDYSHRNRILETHTTFDDQKIKILCMVKKYPVKQEINSALKKSNLMCQTFKHKLVLKSQKGEEFIGWS